MKIKTTVRRTIRYPYYICGCGRKLAPKSNPSKCAYCGRVTVIR